MEEKSAFKLFEQDIKKYEKRAKLLRAISISHYEALSLAVQIERNQLLEKILKELLS